MDRQRNRNETNNRENDSPNVWEIVGGVLAGVAGIAAIAGGIYYATKKEEEKQEAHAQGPNGRLRSASDRFESRSSSDSDEPGPSSYNSGIDYESAIRRRGRPGFNQPINNLESLLDVIYVRYVAILLEDFSLHYKIFTYVLMEKLHKTMKTVDPYYKKYASTVQFGGSHFDGSRIEKPDEFDVDIVIKMPISYEVNIVNPMDSDVNFEPQDSGYLELKMGTQFKKLPFRDGADSQVNKTAYNWMDQDGYLRRSKFFDWFKGVVVKACNKIDTDDRNRRIWIDDVEYTIRRSESGPAITMIVENTDRGFKMDFDLVPALRFPETRWPVNEEYQDIRPDCRKEYWMVVPKPNLYDPLDETKKSRSWRFALQNQERQLIHNRYNLKQALRLMKKLRDTQGMKAIASYYIKTLFFWEVLTRENDELFWNRSPAKLFTIMVKRLYDAVDAGEIPYFWNSNNNLISKVKRTVLDDYRRKLGCLITALEDPTKYKMVANFLLNSRDLEDFTSRYPDFIQ